MSQLIISTQLIVLELRKCRVAHITETVEPGSEEMERQGENENKSGGQEEGREDTGQVATSKRMSFFKSSQRSLENCIAIFSISYSKSPV